MPFDKENLTPAERELASALAGLSPIAPGFTLQQIEIRALIARERYRTRLWQTIAALLAITAGAGFYSRLTPPPSPARVERVVLHDRDRDKPQTPPRTNEDAAPPSRDQPAQASYAYLKLREKVLSEGVESLRASRGTPIQSAIEPLRPPRRVAPPELPAFVEYMFSGGRL